MNEELKKDGQIKLDFYKQTDELIGGTFKSHVRDAAWQWFETELTKAKEYGFQAGCDFTDKAHKATVQEPKTSEQIFDEISGIILGVYTNDADLNKIYAVTKLQDYLYRLNELRQK